MLELPVSLREVCEEMKEERRKTILVIDGNNLSYRQSVVSELHTSTGIATSVIYSILKGLTSFINKFDAFNFVICWDTHRSRRRLALFPGYKSGRRKERTPEEQEWYTGFIAQIQMTRKVLDFLKIPQVSVDHVEADDLMALLGGILSKKFEVILVSTDKDLLQCVVPNVSVYNPFKKKLFTYENCLETIGLTAEQYLFARALMGDGSDSIPGIKGVGEKTAFEMVKTLRIPNLEFLKMFISTCEKKKKVYDKVVSETALIERNLKLMRLPMLLSDLDAEEKELVQQKVNADLLKCILVNRKMIQQDKFYKLMEKLELYSVLSQSNLELLKIQLI